MRLGSILKNRVAHNAGWIIAGRVYHMLGSFLISLLTARFLGPGNFGLINYAATYTTFFASFCSLGINSIIVKNFVDHPEEEGETIGSAIVLRAISSGLSVIVMLGITLIADRGEPQTHLVVALCGVGVIFQVMDTLNYWFQVRLQSKYCAIASAISYTVVCAYKFGLLFTGKSVAWFAVSTSIDHLLAGLVLVLVYRRLEGPRFRASLGKAKQLLSSSHHFILSGLMVSVYGSTDKFMLKQMMSEAEVGYYTTAVSMCNTWVFLLSGIIDSLNPVVMQSFDRDSREFEKKNRLMYAAVFYLSLVVSGLFVLLAKPMISFLYGQSYLPAVAPLRIITWYTAFSYLGVARNAWIVCHQKQKYLKYLYLEAALTNVALNFLWIPQWGPSGAAAASLVTQVSTILVFPVLIPQLRPNVHLILDAIRMKNLF